MTRSYTNTTIYSRSEYDKVNKSRSYRKIADRASHHSVRMANKNADEESFCKFDCTQKSERINPQKYHTMVSNVKPSHSDTHKDIIHNDKWKNKKRPLKDSIVSIIKEDSCIDEMYCRNVLKQLDRRNKMGIFKGHSRD
jgi:hypothetical protein